MHVNIISSMDKRDQSGGAALRCHVFDYVYKQLNLKTTHFYQNDIPKFHNTKSVLRTLYYGKKTGVIFKKAKITLDRPGLLHLDNLRHLSWDYAGHKPTQIIFNAHNLEYENYFDRTTSLSSKRFQNFEIQSLNKADLVCLCSERERDKIVTLNPNLEEKTIVIPNLVKKSDYTNSENKNTISFIGTLNYYPNVKAVHFLCDHFINNLPDKILSTYRFVIAGRNPDQGIIDKIKNSPFELMINPNDTEIKKLFSQSLIQLVPLESGSGTRLKIIEAIFSGSHILSTPLGREGIENQLITESDLNEFVNAFKKLVRSTGPTEDAIKSFTPLYDLKAWTNNNLKTLNEKILRCQ